jgi:hypothetical protein
MTLDNKRYQLHNYVKLLEGTLVRITSISYDKLNVELNGSIISLGYDEVYPVILTESLIEAMGFRKIKKTEYALHQMVSYEKTINGKMYYAKVFIYKDSILWNMKELSFKYVHQMQNILSIIESSYVISLEDIKD